MKKGFLLRFEAEEIERLKKVAKQQNKSVNRFVKDVLDKAEASPNLALGNWWANPDALRKIIKEARK